MYRKNSRISCQKYCQKIRVKGQTQWMHQSMTGYVYMGLWEQQVNTITQLCSCINNVWPQQMWRIFSTEYNLWSEIAEYYQSQNKRSMDYLTFTERLKLLLSLSRSNGELTKETKAFLLNSSPNTKSKQVAIDLMCRFFTESTSSDFVLDLYRDLLPGLVSRFLQKFMATPTTATFSLATKLYSLYPAFRPLITSAFSMARFNPSMVLITYLPRFDLERTKIESLLRALHRLMSISGSDYVTGLWDCSGMIQGTLNVPKGFMNEGALYNLWLTITFKIIGYSSAMIESALGKDKALEVEELVESHQKIIQEQPLAHALEPPNNKDTAFLTNADFSENCTYVVPDIGTNQSSGLVFTQNLKRLHKTLSQLITYDSSKPILLVGPQGTGKTSLIEQLASNRSISEELTSTPKLIQIYMDETLDTKSLVGTFVCAESYGEFTFKKGPLAAAAEQGWWVVLENIDKANDDIMSILVSFIEKGQITLPTREGKVIAHEGFRIFATSQSDIEHSSKNERKTWGRYFHILNVPEYTEAEAKNILKAKFPMYDFEDLLKVVYASVELIADKVKARKANWGRPITFTDLMKVSKRIESAVQKYYGGEKIVTNNYLVEQFRAECISELYDCLLSYIDSVPERLKVVEELCAAKLWSVDPTTFITQLTKVVPKMQYSSETFTLTVGRCTDLHFATSDEKVTSDSHGTFAYTSYALRGFESISQALKHDEGLLLVGPTGVGKTLIVQQIAKMMNKKLVVYNMNCMSDASDLMGGFKPVAPKFVLLPFVESFLKLFCEVVDKDANQAFIGTLTSAFNKNQYQKVFKCVDTALTAFKGQMIKKGDPKMVERITSMQEENKVLQKKIVQMKGHFAYQYIEGALVKSLQNGDWVLLDELNLASDELLQKLAPLIEGRSLTVSDRSDLLPVKRHPHFRLICCMNPGGTVGKRQLPVQIRSKFTEIFMGDLEDESDILYLIRYLTMELNDDKLVNGLTQFYLGIKQAANQMQLQTVNNKKPTFSVRNLCRAIEFIRKAVGGYGLPKAIQDGIEVCLLSQLSPASKVYCGKLLANCVPLLKSPTNHPVGQREGCILYSGYNLPKGRRVVLPSEDPDKWFVTTSTFEDSLRQLAKIVANTQLPILLEGHTSSGKTAMIEYLACKTFNNCIRINNHLNTDVQEYIGSYVPDSTGKLYFQEGALIEAVRNGYWVILDELNLAPSEVLEALNRLLDDNREIYIAETQTMLKAHPMFRVFATQNPTEGYGGRKELSEAFRNRFISLNIPEIPLSELATVVEKRCRIAPSFAKRMVNIMEELQLNRRETDILSGKQSFMTVRDLIKWATRPIVTVEDIAYEGYILLAERLRSAGEKEIVRKVIEKHCKAKLNIKEYYNAYCEKKEVGAKIEKFNESLRNNPIGGLTKISWTNSMKRLYALTDKCVKNKEPVLLVGETGCGKTTVCQLISLFENIPMYTISCHQNTEASDFIGGLRTVTSGHSAAGLAEELKAELIKLVEVLEGLGKLFDEPKEEAKALIMGAVDLKLARKFLVKLSRSVEKGNMPPQVAECAKKAVTILNQEGKIFEWKNGPLVKAMVEGGILLIDEISLTDDSVIERINSVLEKERVLVLSEKSSESVEKYVAHEQFCVLATMNPGGDYGKKELSPALRNRFTEIWVDSFFTDEDFLSFAKLLRSALNNQSKTNIIWSESAEHIDLYQVIREKLLVPDLQVKDKLCKCVLQFACWYNQVFIKEMNIERKALSLRDVLSILEFLSANYGKMTSGNCYFDALSLIILDGISTNSDVSSNQFAKDKINSGFVKFLLIQISAFSLEFVPVKPVDREITNTATTFGLNPYFIPKLSTSQEPLKEYCIEVKTPKENLHRVLRAMSLGKPLLLEGSPGVGKTSLLEHLAKLAGQHVVSISLSEQTDMMDLLGCEYPVTSEHSITNKPEFKWCDGILLKAVKEGWWVIIDELNLASQSVLEGLNAILDHRKTIFIPELNAEYQCHPQFRFFATQSPARQGAARKNLPKSFMNRFAKIYLDSLTEQDLIDICAALHPEIDRTVAQKLVRFNEKCLQLKESFMIQSSIEYNLRDLKKVLSITKSIGLLEGIDIIYLRNVRQKQDRRVIKGLFAEVFGEKFKKTTHNLEIKVEEGTLKCGNASIDINPSNTFTGTSMLPTEGKTLIGKERKTLEQLVHCLGYNWPILITGPEATGKTILLKKLAALTNHKVIEIIVGGNTDSTELLGFYEQANISTLLLGAKERLDNLLSESLPLNPTLISPEAINILSQIEKCRYKYRNTKTEMESLIILKELAGLIKSAFGTNAKVSQLTVAELNYLEKIEEITQKGKFVGRFEWIDSELVKGVQNGSWVIIKNANACSASILDRINPLLDEDNKLIINEAGIIGDKFRVVERHPKFRLFFVYDYKLGELSRGLRNRCVELCIPTEDGFWWSTDKTADIETMEAAFTCKPIWVESAKKSLTLDKAYVKDCVQLLKRVGIISEVRAISMIVFHHTIIELSKSENINQRVSIRQLITWGKLCSQMSAVTSNFAKALKWSCKIAYSQQILKVENFTGVFAETLSNKSSGKIDAVITQWNSIVSTTGLEKAFGSTISLHNIESMLLTPKLYWQKYAVAFLDLLEYVLSQLGITSSSTNDGLEGDMRKKRARPEKSSDPDKELLVKSSLHRIYATNKIDVPKERLYEAVLKIVPYIEHEAKKHGDDYKNISKILAAYCSEVNKGLRNMKEADPKVVQLLTSSDIDYTMWRSGIQADANSYFPKKLNKLRKAIHSITARSNTPVATLLQLVDYAVTKSFETTSDLGLIIFPCVEKIEKLLLPLNPTTSETRLLGKLRDKALASCQLSKTIMNTKKNPILSDFIKHFSFDSFVPRSERMYRAYQKLVKVLSPFVVTVGNRQEPSEYRIHYNDDMLRDVQEILGKYKNEEEDLEALIKELAEKYQIEMDKKFEANEIMLSLSDLEEQPEEDAGDGTLRIPVIEKVQDLKRLKAKTLIDFAMILKDSADIHAIYQGNSFSNKTLRRYSKRRTTIISQVLASLANPALVHDNNYTQQLWTYSGLVLSKAMLNEYAYMAQKKFMGETGLPKYRLLLTYVRNEFTKNMRLQEISYKMDYMLKLKSICSSCRSNQDPNKMLKTATFGLKCIMEAIRDDKMKQMVDEILQLLEETTLERTIDVVHDVLRDLNTCLAFTQKWESAIESGEIRTLFVGIQRFIQEVFNEYSKGKYKTLSAVEGLVKIKETVLHILAGKVLVYMGHPAINMAKQIKLPVYIEFMEYAIQKVYEELATNQWIYELRTQDYKSSKIGGSLEVLRNELNTKIEKLKKYKGQYRFRDVSQLGALVSLIDSLEVKATSAKGLIESLYTVKSDNTWERIGELKILKSNIAQGLVKILTNYLDCNQDVLTIYILGLGIILKAYTKMEHAGYSNKICADAFKLIKCGDIDYDFSNKSCIVSDPVQAYVAAIEAVPAEFQQSLYKQFINFISTGRIERDYCLEGRMNYLYYLIDRYFALDQKEDEGTYKYHGRSLSEKIMQKYKAIDEMTKSENMAKKAEERRKELEEEFSEYLAPEQSLEKFVKKVKAIPEKLEYEIHRIISGKLDSNPCMFITNGQKLANKTQARIPSHECLLQTSVLMQNALNTLSTKIESIDDSIRPPTETYHFYKDPNPPEVKLVHNPVMQLLARLKVLLFEYPNNLILQSIAQMCDKLLLFDVWKTPVAKVMAGLELIVNKAHEWQALASKRLNSIDKELGLIYRIVVRYRKLQLVSWNALLNSKKEEYEMLPSETRLASLLVLRLCRDNAEGDGITELHKIVNQYLVNSVLATYPYRYKVVKLVEEYLTKNGKSPVKNMLKYILKFYEGYQEVYENKMKELHKPIHDKMVELIRIAKWDVSNYYAFHNCISHNHLQLMRIIKDYGELLKQPFSTNVLVKHRESTILSDSHVFQLTPETGESLDVGQKLQYNPVWEEMNEIIHNRIQEVKETESKATRRRALVDLFKKLKEEKVESSYKKLLAEGHMYQREHFDNKILEKAFEHKKDEKIAKVSKYYYKSMDNVNVMFALPAFHEHLSRQEIEAMKGFGYNLLFSMSKYTGNMLSLSKQIIDLDQMIERLPEALTGVLLTKSLADGLVKESTKLCENVRQTLEQMWDINCKYNHSIPIDHVQAYLEKYKAMKIFKNLQKDPVAYDKAQIQDLATKVKELAIDLEYIVENTNTLYFETTNILRRCSWIMKQKAHQLEELLELPSPGSSTTLILESIHLMQEKVQKVQEVFNNAPAMSCISFENLLLRSLAELDISDKAKKEILEPIINSPSVETIKQSRDSLKAVNDILRQYAIRALKHMHVFSRAINLITTIFANMLKNGFCVHETSEEDEGEAQENQKMIEEVNGMGLGEGVGKQDVSDELQHEEQIEGLKGDVNETEDAPENKKDLDKGFEMEEDFQGDINDLGEEGKKEAEEKKEGDLQREMEEDMGKGEENKLWNDENELPEEDEKEENKEPEGDVQDLTNKKVEAGKDKEKQMKAAEDDKQAKGEGMESEEEMSPEAEGKEEFKEALKDDEFHLEKNKQMEGLESDHEQEGEDLSLSMKSQEEENDNNEEEEEAEGFNEEDIEPKEDQNENEEAPEVDQEVENENKAGPEEKKEEESLAEELPKGAPSNAQNPDASTMPFGTEEEKAAAGKSTDNANIAETLYSQFDIAKVVNEQFEKNEAKKRQSENIKGKLGDNKREVNKDLTITAEENRPAEDRKPMADDEVVARDEDDDGEEAQAIGETLMELGNENVAEGEINENEEVERPEVEEEKKDEMPSEAAPTKITESKKSGKSERTKKDSQPLEKMQDLADALKEEDEIKKVEPMEVDQKTIIGLEKRTDKVDSKVDISQTPYISPEKYEEEKAVALKTYYEWLSVPEKSAAANEMLQKLENLTRGLSASLCEQLRILLEPTQRTKLKGDYKTGKRLNMKKIIPFLASNYRNDKIWMRRSVPNKRDYKILLMIDDSLSMKEHNLGFFALESVVAILQALDILEIGEVCVGAMRDNLKIVHGFNEKYTRQKAGYILSSFGFDFNEVNSADYSLANCVNDANHILDMQHFNTRTISIIISDGRFNKSNVKPYLVEAADKGYTYVMIVLDDYGTNPAKSILNMKSTKWVEKGGKRELEIVPHLQDFPFEFYCVLQDIAHLPFTLSNVLLNWFKQSIWSQLLTIATKLFNIQLCMYQRLFVNIIINSKQYYCLFWTNIVPQIYPVPKHIGYERFQTNNFSHALPNLIVHVNCVLVKETSMIYAFCYCKLVNYLFIFVIIVIVIRRFYSRSCHFLFHQLQLYGFLYFFVRFYQEHVDNFYFTRPFSKQYLPLFPLQFQSLSLQVSLILQCLLCLQIFPQLFPRNLLSIPVQPVQTPLLSASHKRHSQPYIISYKNYLQESCWTTVNMKSKSSAEQ
eukprot:TRINITY_DN2645_c0_g1_i1.p1 TRINITY_DN2645_c0_g1~~TRINITY_DN2645_c0_g1_i1.p1  ORF type:complete len:5413 (+),score=668.55 TRINITY_DN2645_c0_g1_i1:2932-19170(+)